MSEKLKVYTHMGIFHGDDVAAVAIMAMCGGIELHRVFKLDHELIPGYEVAVDIGGKCDSISYFDHHQRGGAGMRPSWVSYASAGLVWAAFADHCVRVNAGFPLNEDAVIRIAKIIDDRIISGIDDHDNGNQSQAYSVSHLISSFNLRWDETAKSNDRFNEAVEVVKGILSREIKYAASTEKASGLISEAAMVHPENLILEQFVPAQDWVNRLGLQHKLVTFPSLRGGWSCQTLRNQDDSDRFKFPESWRGLEGDILREETGISDASFCHRGGFICGSTSKEGILQMAALALASTER